MTDPEIDALLKQAAAKPQVDPALIERLTGSLGSSLQPVRPLPPVWILAGSLALFSAAAAVAGALLLGPGGFRLMSALDIAAIFPVLGLLLGLASLVCAAQAVPGSRQPLAPWVMAVYACVALAVVFGLLFHDYGTERFVSQGMRCLIAGLAQAVPVSAAAWWILRRGFAVNPPAAGFAKGALAGLAGVAMLEIHCPNFEVPHILVWHLAVPLVAGALGTLAARLEARRRAG